MKISKTLATWMGRRKKEKKKKLELESFEDEIAEGCMCEDM